MKILKYIAFTILALVFLFIVMGLLKPSISYGHEITVNKPIKEAWAVTKDESKYADWLEGFKSMELISGEEGQVGSKYKIIVNPGDGQADFEMIETVVSVKEFDHIEMDFDSDMMLFDQRYTHTEKDGKTTIRSDAKVTGKGLMMKSMFAFMEMLTGSFQKQEAKNMEALKKVIEANTTDYYPEPVQVDTTAGVVETTLE